MVWGSAGLHLGDLSYLIEMATLEMAKIGTNGGITVDEYMDKGNEE